MNRGGVRGEMCNEGSSLSAILFSKQDKASVTVFR
jgi:hypothetical protein